MVGRKYGSPNMSDTTLLVSVEDLINMAMGPSDVNVVNFKMIQTVLHILARQLRMLETQVEIRISEAPPPKVKKEKKKQPEPPSTDSSSSKSPRKISPPPKSPMKGIKEEKAKPFRDKEKEREDKAAAKDKEKAEKSALKDKEKEGKLAAKEREQAEKDKSKADRASSKEREKAERAESKERDKAGRAESKEREKADKAAAKEKDKGERAESREREKGDKAAMKDREKAERAESKEREKADKSAAKDKEKAQRAESKEREKGERAESKEKEKAEKAALKDKEKMEKMSAKDREKAEKEKEKLEKMDAKEREKAEKEKEKLEKMSAKDREKAEKEKEKLEKIDAKEREKAEKEKEKLEKMSAKDREKAEKEKEKLEKMDAKEREKAEKEKEKLDKMSAKDREKAEKEKEKLEKMDAKEREKAEREKEKLEKMSAKDREKAEREQEKLEKMSAKDREKAEREKEKADKAAAKEKEKLDKMSAKEREKYEKELAKEKAKEEREKSAKDKTGISVKEKDKVLIVEKGPTTRTDSRTRVGSIEVVTVSQFELLEATVRELKEKAGPLPFPALPDNQKLRSELAKGSASLTDTMQAMQVTARVQAAEAAIGRMAGLLTQLAAAGALPQDVAGKMEDVKAEMDAITEESTRARPSTAGGVGRKSVAIDPMSKKASTTSKMEARPSSAVSRPSITSKASAASKASIGQPGVTHIEMDDALRSLKDDLTKNVNVMTSRATAAAETAAATAKAVADKLDIALKLNTRINTLYSLVTDYAEQLNGFDAGLTTQMQSFQEQMAQMRNDLKGGITQLEAANNNAETAAVMELTERYEGLVSELDLTVHAHQALTAFQSQLGDELHSLLECVEMLREQKADRDEVLDGLRDKADNSRLAGLLTELEFANSRAELERRLDLCYDKFRKQENVWMGAIRDLTGIAEGKAEIMQLLAARDNSQQQLRDIQDRLQKLAVILGEPKAAMLTRQLSKGARCGACQIPALQEPYDSSFGKPPPLPAMRLPPAGAEEKPCIPEWKPPQPPDDRDHTCHRWVGGSHTLLADSVVREEAGPLQILGPPTKRYTGYGSDGRLYMMEEELLPCVECNMISTDTDKAPEEELKQPEGAIQADGAGDTGLNQTAMELPP